MTKINVLSLFDGISCGQVALERAGVKVNKYYASEINQKAIEITQKNYPNTIQLGDVADWKTWDLPTIDLLIGGSPCQNLSVAVVQNDKHNQGLLGEKSKLFYSYVDVLKHIKPKYFLLENVASMKGSDKDIISKILNVEPIMIDSSLVSAQTRKRYYWSNIPVGELPVDKGLVLEDIMQKNVDEKYFYKQDFELHGADAKVIATLNIKGHDILKRVYNPLGKCATLTACRGGNLQKKVLQYGRVRKLTPLEYERLQTLPDGYTEGVADTHRYNALGDGWTVDVIAHIFKNINDDYVT